MASSIPPPVREIIDARSGEEMALNDRFLNPQMGRILRTLGFDRVWSGGEGAHLIDSTGERYLDLLGGYGVFAIGRNHPEAIAAIEEVMQARTATCRSSASRCSAGCSPSSCSRARPTASPR